MNRPYSVSQLIEKYSNENEELPKRIEALLQTTENVHEISKTRTDEYAEIDADIEKYSAEDALLTKRIALLEKDCEIIASDFEKVFHQYSDAKEDLKNLTEYCDSTEAKLAQSESDKAKSQKMFEFHCRRIEHHLKFLKECSKLVDLYSKNRKGISPKELELIELIVGAREELQDIGDMIKKFKPRSVTPQLKNNSVKPVSVASRPISRVPVPKPSSIPIPPVRSNIPRPTRIK